MTTLTSVRPLVLVALSAGMALPAATLRAQAPGFYYIGKLGGPGTELAVPFGIGPGPTVIGTNDYQRNDGNFRRAFTWTPAAEMNPLANTPNSGVSSGAYALSADGSVLVGVLGIAPGASGTNPQVFRRVNGGPDEILPLAAGMEYPQVKGISGAGTIIAGYVNGYGGGGQAVTWTGTSTAVPLPNLPAAPSSQALGISADGTVVVGWSGRGYPFDNTPVRWVNGQIESLGLPPECTWAWAYAASGDGSVIVGLGWVPGGSSRAWKWTAQSGMTLLDDGPHNFAEATSISDDGRTIGGRIYTDSAIWRDGVPYSVPGELIPPGTVLAPIISLSGTVIMSHDGKVIAGVDRGIPPMGDVDYYAWAVVLPESLGCVANCDGSAAAPVLTANDFQCFLNKFAAGDPFANCDHSTVNPTLTANDFQCFLNVYAIGCT